MFTWHLTFADTPKLHRLVLDYQRALAELPGLNLVPPEWLHLTMQGVAYADEISADELRVVIQAVREAVSGVPQFDLTFGGPLVIGEAIAIRPEPAEPLQQLLVAIRAGIADALGPDSVRTGPEQARGFRPHLSIAYSNADMDAEPYAAAIVAVDAEPAAVHVREATLIRQERQLKPHWLYRWTVEATTVLQG